MCATCWRCMAHLDGVGVAAPAAYAASVGAPRRLVAIPGGQPLRLHQPVPVGITHCATAAGVFDADGMIMRDLTSS